MNLDRDYPAEIERDVADLDTLDQLHVLAFVCWLWLQHKTRRAWLRFAYPWLDPDAAHWSK